MVPEIITKCYREEAEYESEIIIQSFTAGGRER